MGEPQNVYEGKEPYLFASYAHKDREKVLPLIGLMQEVGCRVWYDNGIEPTKEYNDVIASHIENSRLFTCFMSNAYASRNYCKMEFTHAQNKNRDILTIYLENPKEIKMPSGMEMQLGSIQYIDISSQTPNRDEEFIKRLDMTNSVRECRKSITPERV